MAESTATGAMQITQTAENFSALCAQFQQLVAHFKIGQAADH